MTSATQVRRWRSGPRGGSVVTTAGGPTPQTSSREGRAPRPAHSPPARTGNDHPQGWRRQFISGPSPRGPQCRAPPPHSEVWATPTTRPGRMVPGAHAGRSSEPAPTGHPGRACQRGPRIHLGLSQPPTPTRRARLRHPIRVRKQTPSTSHDAIAAVQGKPVMTKPSGKQGQAPRKDKRELRPDAGSQMPGGSFRCPVQRCSGQPAATAEAPFCGAGAAFEANGRTTRWTSVRNPPFTRR